MSCYNPNIRVVSNSVLTKNGKPATYKFINHLGDKIKRYKDGTINYEWYIEQNKIEGWEKYQMIPCGKCIGCKQDHQREWAIRCILEADNYESNYFITLTYDDKNKPWDDTFVNTDTGEIFEDDGTWNGYLEPKDMTDFIKRLRERWERKYDHCGIRYFYCGEYGKNERPHYHAIFFNLPIKAESLKVYRIDKETGKMLYTSEEFDKLWGKGFVVIEEFDYNSAAYVAGYVQKKQASVRDREFYAKKGQTPEFIRMSRDGGIGKKYLIKHPEIYDNDEIITKTGRMKVVRAKIPRYFDKLTEEIDSDRIKELQSKRKENANTALENKMKQTTLTLADQLKNEKSEAEKKGKIYTKRDKV